MIVFPQKLWFLPTKLIIQNCYNLKIQQSKFSTINSIHTRQSSLYFCTIKIQNFNHIYVQKNIKVVQFIENLHCQKAIRPWGVKEKPYLHVVWKCQRKINKNSIHIELPKISLLPKNAAQSSRAYSTKQLNA